MTASQNILTIAGPNGAGKTTFARSYLLNEADHSIFVNADMIAEGLDPFNPERAAFAAGRVMLRMIDEYVPTWCSFSRLRPHWSSLNIRVRAIPPMAGDGLLGSSMFSAITKRRDGCVSTAVDADVVLVGSMRRG